MAVNINMFAAKAFKEVTDSITWAIDGQQDGWPRRVVGIQQTGATRAACRLQSIQSDLLLNDTNCCQPLCVAGCVTHVVDVHDSQAMWNHL